MKLSRRKFVSSTMLAAAGTLASGYPAVEGRNRSIQGANNRIGIGLIGCGNYCNSLMNILLRHHESLNIHFPALCDVHTPQMDRMSSRIVQAGGNQPFQSTKYQDVVAHPDVDAVLIASADFGHGHQMVEAAGAGKHIWVEKPMATRMVDANAALDAVRKNNIVCQVGTQRRADRQYIGAARYLKEQQPIGQLISADACWNVNDDRWSFTYDHIREEDVDWEAFLMYLPYRPFNPHMVRAWRRYKDCSCGPIGLLGTHLIDVAAWFLDDPIPERVVGVGDNILWTERRENMDYQQCIFTYPKGYILHYISRFQNSYGGDGNIFYGTDGTFKTDTWTFSGEGGGDRRLQQPVTAPEAEGMGSNSRENLLRDWISCMRSGKTTLSDIHAGYAHSVAAIMGFQACLTGQPVVYDSHKRRLRVL